MASYVTPKKNAEFIFYLSLVKQSDTKLFQVNPTLAAGDVKVSIEGGAEANVTTLPVVTPAGSRRVKVTLSAAEMNGDNIQLTFSDAAGAEWCDTTINIQTSARQVDDLLPTASYTTPPTVTQIQAELEEDGASLLDTLIDRLTAARAGYLDKLNITGNVAASGEVTAIQNNTRIVIAMPSAMERPDSGGTVYRVWLYLYDEVGNAEAPDAIPNVRAENEAGTDRSANLSVVTNVGTGVYRVDYTLSSGAAIEQLLIEFSILEGGVTRVFGRNTQIVDTTAVDFTSADRTKLNTLHDTRLTASRAANLDNLDAAVSSRAATGAAMTLADGAIATAKIVDGAITSAKFTVAGYAGLASGFLERCDQLWRRFFKRHKHDKTLKKLETFSDANVLMTTQTYTSDAATDDVGAAT